MNATEKTLMPRACAKCRRPTRNRVNGRPVCRECREAMKRSVENNEPQG